MFRLDFVVCGKALTVLVNKSESFFSNENFYQMLNVLGLSKYVLIRFCYEFKTSILRKTIYVCIFLIYHIPTLYLTFEVRLLILYKIYALRFPRKFWTTFIKYSNIV